METRNFATETNYLITYSGNSRKFKDFEKLVVANDASQAIVDFYAKKFSSNYFPQEDGSILDSDSYKIYSEGSDSIEYDGGYFSAKKVTFDLYFNDSNHSNNKGWEASYDYCLEHIECYNGTNDSCFGTYKGGYVSIYCNETEETVYETKIIDSLDN